VETADGLSRTESKRRYITTSIDTMHKYASPSPDSRKLVAELELVWDQVKSNVPLLNFFSLPTKVLLEFSSVGFLSEQASATV
jgi:hypothetical protein